MHGRQFVLPATSSHSDRGPTANARPASSPRASAHKPIPTDRREEIPMRSSVTTPTVVFGLGAGAGAWRHAACGIGILVVMAVSAVAQTPDASIIGQVRDESGAVLPGAAVTATSPSLQVPSIVVVTNEIGEYRISPLPIGTYEVTYTLPGFGTVKQSDIRLTVGFVAKLDVVLKVGSLEENVTVSGGSPVVDVTSTVTSTRLTKETLELTPSTRNGVLSLMQQAPGLRGNLDLGGSNFSAIPSFSAYGQSNEQWSTLEGVLTQDPIGGTASGNYWDYSAFEETQVSAIGKGVEIPVRGVQLGAIVKTGGNDFHGSGFFSGTNYHFQSN